MESALAVSVGFVVESALAGSVGVVVESALAGSVGFVVDWKCFALCFGDTPPKVLSAVEVFLPFVWRE